MASVSGSGVWRSSASISQHQQRNGVSARMAKAKAKISIIMAENIGMSAWRQSVSSWRNNA